MVEKRRKKARRKTIKTRLIEKLTEQGFEVEWIDGAQGYHRINRHLDDTTVCWEAHVIPFDGGSGSMIYSWDTMTDCVRYGITVDLRDSPAMVYANTPDGLEAVQD